MKLQYLWLLCRPRRNRWRSSSPQQRSCLSRSRRTNQVALSTARAQQHQDAKQSAQQLHEGACRNRQVQRKGEGGNGAIETANYDAAASSTVLTRLLAAADCPLSLLQMRAAVHFAADFPGSSKLPFLMQPIGGRVRLPSAGCRDTQAGNVGPAAEDLRRVV